MTVPIASRKATGDVKAEDGELHSQKPRDLQAPSQAGGEPAPRDPKTSGPKAGSGKSARSAGSAKSVRSSKSGKSGSLGKAKRRVVQLGSLVGLIALWWLVTTVTNINPVVLPSPGAVAHELWATNTCHPMSESSARTQCGVEGYFLWQHLLATIERIAVGLISGTIVGVLLGWVLGSSQTVRAIVEPYLSFLRALPPLGYIGLLIVWFGIGDVSKVVLLFLAVFPTVTVATITGVTGIKQDWILAARTLGARRAHILRRVIIPGALPEIINGIRLGAGLAWAAIVAAEMNDGIPGIGGLAYISGTQLNTALTIASIIVIGVTALIIDQLLVLVERRFAPWRGKQ